MSRRIAIVVLHEDALHQSFASAFFREINLPVRLRATRYSKAVNKSGVQKNFAAEAISMLKQGAETHLFVIVDADSESYEQNLNRLVITLTDVERERLESNGRFLLICPNYELENWCRNLEGTQVTEDRNVTLAYKNDSDCREAARFLAITCKTGQPLVNPLPSMVDACTRWTAYKVKHNL